MKGALLALVLGIIAPLHVTLGPVSLPVLQLLAAVEFLAAGGSAWLAVRIIREARRRRHPAWISGGAL